MDMKKDIIHPSNQCNLDKYHCKINAVYLLMDSADYITHSGCDTNFVPAEDVDEVLNMRTWMGKVRSHILIVRDATITKIEPSLQRWCDEFLIISTFLTSVVVPC